MPKSRGEIYFVELGPTRGRELNDKRRPVVVLSINDINRKPLVVTVVPGKTYLSGKPIFMNQVMVNPTLLNGLANITIFECMQIKALDHGRFDRDTAEQLLEVETAIKRCLGLT
jgi:mRNA interferase MazF